MSSDKLIFSIKDSMDIELLFKFQIEHLNVLLIYDLYIDFLTLNYDMVYHNSTLKYSNYYYMDSII